MASIWDVGELYKISSLFYVDGLHRGWRYAFRGGWGGGAYQSVGNAKGPHIKSSVGAPSAIRVLPLLLGYGRGSPRRPVLLLEMSAARRECTLPKWSIYKNNDLFGRRVLRTVVLCRYSHPTSNVTLLAWGRLTCSGSLRSIPRTRGPDVSCRGRDQLVY